MPSASDAWKAVVPGISRDTAVVGVMSPLDLIDQSDTSLALKGRMIIHVAMVHKRRGNPNWGKSLPSPSAVPTEFEGVTLRLGLTKETYSSSSQLRVWCERNGNRCYIPEWLLKEWDIMPDVGWS
jgi:hypothetical protein